MRWFIGWWLAIVLLNVWSCSQCYSQDLNPVQRVRIILDVGKDGDVATPAAYAQVDLIGVAEGSKWVNAIWTYYNGTQEATNQEKARFYLNQLRAWHRMHLKHDKEITAVADATTEANTETTTDLGADEVVMSNEAPTAVVLSNKVTTLPESTDTASAVKVADIAVTDDEQGNNVLALTGADAAMFEIQSNVLYLKAGSTLSNATNPVLDVTVTVDDPGVGSTPDASAALAITVTAT